MRIPRLLLPVSIALPLAGCISLGGKPPTSLVVLTPAQSAPADTGQTLASGRAVTVITPSAPAELSVNRIPVQTGQTKLAYLKDAQWADAPARLFRDLLAETIRARTGRPTLAQRDYHLAPGPRIGGRIAAFGLDASTMKVTMVFDGTLVRAVGGPVETRRFEVDVPVSAAATPAVAPALDQAANQVAVQVADWIGQ